MPLRTSHLVLIMLYGLGVAGADAVASKKWPIQEIGGWTKVTIGTVALETKRELSRCFQLMKEKREALRTRAYARRC